MKKNIQKKNQIMNNSEIIANYRKQKKLRRMNRSEIDLLVSKIRYPYAGSEDEIEKINADLAIFCEIQVENLKFKPFEIPVFIDKIHKAFLLSVLDPGIPVGPHTADAIGQQATQDLLNTFHQAGTSKPGGSQAIKEDIRMSQKRGQVYSVCHFLNTRYSFKEVLKLKNEILGVSIQDISIRIFTTYVNIEKQIGFKNPASHEEAIQMVEKEQFWWYKFCHHNMVSKTSVIGGKSNNARIAVRIKLDPNKLCELGITTCDVANKISDVQFSIKKQKKKEDETYYYVCFPSPTIFGIIDCFLMSSNGNDKEDYLKDYFLQQSVAMKDFKEIYLSGIKGIENYYPVSKSVTSCIRSVEPAFTIVEENGLKKEVPKGTWVYFKNMRFNHVPISRFISLCKNCGIECVQDPEAIPIANLEFNSHKINRERRVEITLKVNVQNEDDMYRQYRKYPWTSQREKPDQLIDSFTYNSQREMQSYETLFKKVKKIYVEFEIKGKYYYIYKEYVNRNYHFFLSETYEKTCTIINDKAIKLNTLDELYDIFSDQKLLNHYFKNTDVFFVEVNFPDKTRYIKQERICKINETTFEEIDRKIISTSILFFISNEKIGEKKSQREVTSEKEIEELVKNKNECFKVFGTDATNKIFDATTTYITLYYYIGNMVIKRYLIAYKYDTYEVKLKIQRELINDPKQYSSLNTLILNKYCVKDLRIPIEKPKIESSSFVSEKNDRKLRRAILLKTFIPFRSAVSYFTPDENKTDKQNEDDLAKLNKVSTVERLVQFLDSNSDPEEREYVYAETKGASLKIMNTHPLVDPTKTYCNVFNQVLDLYGIEALRNLLNFDLTGVITMSGDIDPLYINHTSDVITAKGKNGFTSKGVSTQGTGPISVITFDKVKENLKKYAQKGKKFSLFSTSTTILTGDKIPLGTGYSTIVVNQSKIGVRSELRESKPDYFRQIDEDDQKLNLNFNIVVGKFPKNERIIEQYVKKSIGYYVDIEVKRFKNAKVKREIPSALVYLKDFKDVKFELKKDYNFLAPILEIKRKKIIV